MKTKKRKTRALVLLSGGLDSILVVKLLQNQGIDVTGISFVSYFFSSKQGQKAANDLNIKFREFDFSDEHLEIVKNPPRGYGKAINPCIDCHLLMLKKANEIMKKDGFDFVATGEVLGERPMSQNREALNLIEKESGLKGYLLRPLSAKLLKPTVVEENGLVNRDELMDISGRNRKPQMALADKYGIKEYPTPAGGCRLTELNFAQRFKNMLKNWPECKGQDVKLLKLGRHFWVPASSADGKDNLVLVGRNREENEEIQELKIKGDIVIEPKGFPGPSILVRGKDKILEESLIKAKELIIKYSKKKPSKPS